MLARTPATTSRVEQLNYTSCAALKSMAAHVGGATMHYDKNCECKSAISIMKPSTMNLSILMQFAPIH